MENLGREVSAESPPRGSVNLRSDDVLIAGSDFAGWSRGWAIGENGAV